MTKDKIKKRKPRAAKEKRARYELIQHAPDVEKRFRLTLERAARLNRFAKVRAVSEDEIVAKALDILFSLADMLDKRVEERGWSSLSQESLGHLWDNDQDAAYDNWRELYGVSAR